MAAVFIMHTAPTQPSQNSFSAARFFQQWFLTFLVFVIAVVALWLWTINGESPFQAIRMAAFNVTSIMTGTGYVTAGFDQWGSFAIPIFFFIKKKMILI